MVSGLGPVVEAEEVRHRGGVTACASSRDSKAWKDGKGDRVGRPEGSLRIARRGFSQKPCGARPASSEQR